MRQSEMLFLVEASKIDGAAIARLVVAEKVSALWIAATVEAVQQMQPTLRGATVHTVSVSGPLAPHHTEHKQLTQAQSAQWHKHHFVEDVDLPYPEVGETLLGARERIETTLLMDVYKNYAATAGDTAFMVVLDGSTLGAFDATLNAGPNKLDVRPQRQRGVVAKYAFAVGQVGLVLEKQIQ